MTDRNAGRHEPRHPGDATIIRLLARRAIADGTGWIEIADVCGALLAPPAG